MMSKQQVILALGALLFICVSVWAAPVKEQDDKKSNGPSAVEVEGDDEDLQELLSLVNKQTHQENVMVHREHVAHIENNNGQSVKVEQKEEKVLDTDSGKLLADVKQQTQESSDQQGEPETIVQTKVDIPSAGVHETFVQDGEADESNEAIDEEADAANAEDAATPEDDPDLTPADMAAYLYATQQFEAFYAAIDRLVNESKMSASDAEAYAKSVALEYEQLQLQDLEDRYALERRSYQQPIMENDLYGPAPGPGYDLYPQQNMGGAGGEWAEPSFDMLAYVNSLMSPEEQEYMAQKQAQAELLSAETIDPYQFVAALWNEAYENGNEEAQEIVRLLYDRVSHDSNTDDMGEIRDILLETVAQSLGDDTPYPYDTPIAMPQMPVQPSINNEEEEEAGLDSSVGVAESAEPNEEGHEASETEGETEEEEEEEQKQEEEEEGESQAVEETGSELEEEEADVKNGEEKETDEEDEKH